MLSLQLPWFFSNEALKNRGNQENLKKKKKRFNNWVRVALSLKAV